MFDLSNPGLLVLALVVGYAFGSIPFGLLLTRWAGTADLRTVGSGNIGATNVLRTGRKDLAAATLLGDALKGTIAVLIMARFGPIPAVAAALGAFLGHLFPVWLRFAGGKGVATFLGCTLALDWRAGLVFIILWLAVAAATRFSSAAALVASLGTLAAFWYFGRNPEALVMAVCAVLMWIKHRENIRRLLAGTESRIGSKR